MGTFREEYDKERRWREKTLIMQTFHLMMTVKHGNWRIVDTATYFKVSKGLVSENLNLARWVKLYAEVNECKSRDEAIKILKSLINGNHE